MKKLLSMILIATLVFALVACAPAPDATPDVTPPDNTAPVDTADPEEPLKFAVLLPSSPNDGAWGQSGAEAAQFAADGLGAELSIIEAGTADVMKSEAEALADAGYKIIFGHGAQYCSPFAEISGEYPDVYFITTGGNIVTDNQFPIQIATEQGAYIQGVIAAKLSKTGKLGSISGGDYPSYMKTCIAFELGAKSVNPDIEVMTTVLNDSNDLNEAYEVAMSHISSGADFVSSNANASSLGAVKAAKENGYYYCGVDVTLEEDPEVMLNNVDVTMGQAWLNVAQRCIEGTAEAEIQVIGLAEGAVAFVWNEELRKTLPEDVRDIADEYIQKITSGEIVVPGE